MTLPDVCALCFGPYGDGTWDVSWDTDECVRVNVCIPCRMAENYMIIRKKCGEE